MLGVGSRENVTAINIVIHHDLQLVNIYLSRATVESQATGCTSDANHTNDIHSRCATSFVGVFYLLTNRYSIGI